ncbi:MAG: hypothetical protein ACLUEQ_09815 [Cloacibacillus evryensis]
MSPFRAARRYRRRRHQADLHVVEIFDLYGIETKVTASLFTRPTLERQAGATTPRCPFKVLKCS